MSSVRLFEYSGVVHVHSLYSDGTGGIPDILNAGRSTGLDFIVLTDHNTLRARAEGWEGRHGDLLLIVGEEITSRQGHCLAIGTTTRVNHRQPPDGVIRDIVAQQGLSFLAHPHGVYRPFFSTRDHSWRDWSVNSYTGLEIWSYMFDWASKFRYYRFLRHYRDPHGGISGPFAETLRKWDRLCQKTRIVGIGGVDAHARRYLPLPFTVFPYAELFGTLRTRVLMREPLTGPAAEDIRRILLALAHGHCFTSYDLLQSAEGTRFASTDGALLMGDEARFEGPVELEVRLPAEAHLTVLRDGRPVQTRLAPHCVFPADSPGVYRVEASRDGRPWIFTNPIYLRSEAPSS